jgi:hypothetical protein
MLYEQKYLKYKQKYLKLKAELEGGLLIDVKLVVELTEDKWVFLSKERVAQISESSCKYRIGNNPFIERTFAGGNRVLFNSSGDMTNGEIIQRGTEWIYIDRRPATNGTEYFFYEI